MKKLFLIPLMAMLCTVMAWGATITVGEGGTFPATDAGLNSAIAAASAGDVIELTSNIAYATNNTGIININKSITLDGKGYTLFGYGKTAVKIDGTSEVWPTSLAVNASVFGAAPSLQVKIQNLTLGNIKDEKWTEDLYKPALTSSSRYFGLSVFDGVDSLALENVKILTGATSYNANTQKVTISGISWGMMFWVSGTNANPLKLSMEGCEINSYSNYYTMYILKPIKAHLSNSTYNGYCGIYFKYRASGAYGNVVGSRTSVINADACHFECPNKLEGESNNFAVFPLEDDGITLNLNNCSYNATKLGNTYQRFLNLQYLTRTSGFQPVNVNVTGDNTHLYNVTANTVVFNGFTVGQGDPDINEGITTRADVAINFTVKAGTFTFDPSDVRWYTYSDNKTAVYVAKNSPSNVSYADQSAGTGAITIDDTKYQINEVKQGDETLYRVVKKAEDKSPGVKYDLNDDVPSDPVEGAGDNPNSSFELSTGTEMKLNQETTNAGYVEVKDNGTNGTTVLVGKVENEGTPTETKVDQTLVINNGLDVQGNSQVVVQNGSNLMIGEGGITTQDPSNIVIEADSSGSASLLLNPAITVNQNPYLTVKMETNVGKYTDPLDATNIIWAWHYFAFPMKAGASWTCTDGSAVVPTYFQGWNYGTNDWESIVPAAMNPFYGYILTYDKPYSGIPGVEGSHGTTKVTYTFTGNLVGNEDLQLEFSAMGWNFFGNSYTAYISTKTFLDNIINDPKVGATIYLWDSKNQQYRSFTRDQINNGLTGTFAWANEVAPMQTFILQKRAAGDPQVEVNYAEAIWNNPRYVSARGESVPAPARVMDTNSARAYITIAAANGQNDYICLMEDSKYSDAYDNGGDGAKYMNAGRINMYITMDNEDYGTLATDNLAGKAISFQTNDQINYTLSISNVLGSQYAIRDIMTNSVISISEGATYDFVAQPNETIEGRFVIVPMQNMPTDVETVETTTAVKGIYTIMGQYVGEDFETLPAGVYVVDGVKIVK